jgi:hypothetical protein
MHGGERDFLRLIVIAALNITAKRFLWMAAQFYGGAQAEIALTIHTTLTCGLIVFNNINNNAHSRLPTYLRALILVVNFSASCANIYGHLRIFPIPILSQRRYAD